MKTFLLNIYYRFYIIFKFSRDKSDSNFLSTLMMNLFLVQYLFCIIDITSFIFSFDPYFSPIDENNVIAYVIIFVASLIILYYLLNIKPKYSEISVKRFENETEKESVKYSWYFGLFIFFSIGFFVFVFMLESYF